MEAPKARMRSDVFIGLAGLFLLCCLSASIASAEELIPPTRTLEEAGEEVDGKLTVVSEPPGLEVFLDGSSLGETPVWLKEVKPGLHEIRIGETETSVTVNPDETLRVSRFKDSFVIETLPAARRFGSEDGLPDEGAEAGVDKRECRYGYYEEPSGTVHCYYGGWGIHVCETKTSLRECRVSGEKANSCTELRNDLRARDCCPETYGGYSRSFRMEHCGKR